MCCAFVLFSMAVVCHGNNEISSFSSLPSLDIPHPFCDSPTTLDIAKDYFVEIANELPGRAEYNQLIQLYRVQQWPELSAAIKIFRRVYEDTPLLEAVAFLETEALFEQSEQKPSFLPDAEKKLRETLLLYPQSTLVPIITGSIAAHWLRQGKFSRALAMYETAARDYAEHELHCNFLFGAAENSFQLHDWRVVKDATEKIIAKCQGMRVQVGAQMRLADLTFNDNPKATTNTYEKIYELNGPIINHYYPMLLYNLGELKYREHKYPSSRFYFNEYLRHRGKEETCTAYALKRVADVSVHLKDKLEAITGLYLAVKETAPKTDVGRYSYLHALLIGFKSSVPAERERRLLVFDTEVDKIGDERLRKFAYLEKGLAMLESGERIAVDYLVRLDAHFPFNLRKGDIGNFVQMKLLEVLHDEVAQALEKRSADPRKSRKLFAPIEDAYSLWLKDSPYEAQAKKLYSEITFSRFQEALEKDDVLSAVERLEHWKKSELWTAQSPSKADRIKFASRLAEYLSQASEEQGAVSQSCAH